MRKEPTIRFFAGTTYLGWKYVRNTTQLAVRSWLRSGNTIKIGNDDPVTKDDMGWLPLYTHYKRMLPR